MGLEAKSYSTINTTLAVSGKEPKKLQRLHLLSQNLRFKEDEVRA